MIQKDDRERWLILLKVVKINTFWSLIFKFLTKKVDPLKVICIFLGIVRFFKDCDSAGKLVCLTHLTVWRNASCNGKYGHISRELLAITLWITCTGWLAIC